MFSTLRIRKIIAIALTFTAFTAKAQIPGSAIDVLHYNFALQLNDADNNIKGQATISVKFLKNAPEFNLNLVKKSSTGKGMLVSAVTENGKKLRFVQDSDVVNIYTGAKLNSIHNYKVSYAGIPADGLIISTNKFGHRTFFGDNWPNRAHNWLPCVDHPADKASVDFVVTAPDHYQVISNGLKIKEQPLPNHLKLTHWHEAVVLPTKVMVIGVAAFAIDHPGNVGNIPVYTYVFPESKETGFKSYAVAKDILPFFIKKVGPFSYEKLANVQSKTIFGGMENASAIFYFEESVNDAGIEELMAHEIAHQWFGDGASEKSFWHLWLSEGFATYMTNLYLENKYGADTLKKRMLKDRNKVLGFEKTRLTPVVDSAVKSDYMQLLNANSYEKGSWVLHMLRRKLGDDLFWKGVRSYYAKYRGSNANTNDLRQIMEQTSGQDLKQFFNQWLRTAGHPQLNVAWHYDADKGTIDFNIEQKQGVAYEFPLEIAIDGQLHSIAINGKITAAQFKVKAKPETVIADPNVNLLATFDVIAN
jgi:aminopeptidase N